MKYILYVLILFLPYSNIQAQEQTVREEPLSFWLTGGVVPSKLFVDSIDGQYLWQAFIGTRLNYRINSGFSMSAGLHFSFRGTKTDVPVYRYRNEYIDLQLMAKVDVSKQLSLDFGYQRANLINSTYKVGSPNPLVGSLLFETEGFKDQNQLIGGMTWEFGQGISINSYYAMGIGRRDFNEFRIGLNLKLISGGVGQHLDAYKSLESALEKPLEVKKLVLHRDKLKAFPIEILELKNLEVLVLDANYIVEIPEEISQLKKLRKLSLKFNSLTKLPESIGDLGNLEELYLHHNDLTELPKSIKNLKKLEFFYIGKNYLKYIPAEIGELESLIELDIAHSGTMLSLPDEMRKLKGLQILYIDGLTQIPFNLKAINPRIQVVLK